MKEQQDDTESALIASALAALGEIREAERNMLRKRYELACIYRKIVDGPRAASGTMLEACAAALQLDPTTISRWACLARAASPAEVEWWISTPTVDGGVIAASRLRDLGLARGKQRERMLQRLFPTCTARSALESQAIKPLPARSAGSTESKA